MTLMVNLRVHFNYLRPGVYIYSDVCKDGKGPWKSWIIYLGLEAGGFDKGHDEKDSSIILA